MKNSLEALHSQFPYIRRTDAKGWSRCQFWPGAMTVLIPRVLIMFICFFMLWLGVSILLIGYDSSGPLVGCRKCLVRTTYKFWMGMIFYLVFFAHSRTVYEQNVDYSEWLGPEDGKPVSASKASMNGVSMVTPNHTGFFEVIALILSDVHPGFAPKAELKKIPFLGKLTLALGGIYIDRFASKDSRTALLD